MTTRQTDAIELEVRIEATPETVFQYFVDPAKVVLWKAQNAELDPTSGGIYRIDVNGRNIARGEYVEVTPPSRVVFTWGWEGDGSPVPPGSSTVEVSLEPDGDATIVKLRHSGLPADQLAPHTDGWKHYLPRLVVAAAGGDPGPDPQAGPE